jgi:hypothetical protein
MCLKAEVCEGKGINRGPECIRSAVVDQVGRGINLIGELDDFTFRRHANGTGSIGEQFRHNLDFLNAFLKGIRVGRIDYEKRERDERVAKSRNYAIERFEGVIIGLENLQRSDLQGMISVASEIECDVWLMSSVLREMEFVHSHTIHHHALIAEKLAGFGISVNKLFGVSPSTLAYWRRAA